MSYDTTIYREILARHDFQDTSDWLPIEHVPEWIRLTGKKAKVKAPEIPVKIKKEINEKIEKIVKEKKKSLKERLTKEEYLAHRRATYKKWVENMSEERRKTHKKKNRGTRCTIGLHDCAKLLGINTSRLQAICNETGIHRWKRNKSYRFSMRRINELREILALDSNNKL